MGGVGRMMGRMIARPRGPPGRPMPFAHHFGDPMQVQADILAG